MGTAIIVVWSLGLIVALVLTIIILKEVASILSVLSNILALTQRIRAAGLGLSEKLMVTSGLPELVPHIEALEREGFRLASVVTSTERKISKLVNERVE